MRVFLGFTMATALLFTLSACVGNGQIKNENPFVDLPAGPVSVKYTSNADTVFLTWKLNAEEGFDAIEVSVPSMNSYSKKYGKSETGAYITHFPYNKAVTISVKLLNKNTEVASQSISANIDGFDYTIAGKIIRDEAGAITAGDGMYSVALPDGRSIFLMGDSFNCAVVDGQRPKTAHMFRNSYLVYDPKNDTATGIVNARGAGTNSSAAVPKDYPFENKWYWPGDGFVIGDRLYIFQSLMYMGADGMWGFRYQDSHLLQYSLPDLKLVRDDEIKYKPMGAELYGAAAMYDGGYAYIYQQLDVNSEWVPLTYAYVARAKEEDLWGSWEFWDGSGWTKDYTKQACMTGADQVCISSQFNVFKLRDKYVLFTENKSLMVGEVYTMTSDNPWGPWSHKKTIYTIPNVGKSDWLTYNAMAHPQFEKDGMILFTIDVNTQDGDEQATDVRSYRPRFIWMDINQILN